MTTTVEAIYENGVLKLPQALDLPEKAHVLVTIQSQPSNPSDSDRAAWMQLSRQGLLRTWDNPEDEAFNELLDR